MNMTKEAVHHDGRHIRKLLEHVRVHFHGHSDSIVQTQSELFMVHQCSTKQTRDIVWGGVFWAVLLTQLIMTAIP